MSNPKPFPGPEHTTVQFAHVAYQFDARYALRDPVPRYFQTRAAADTAARIAEPDVLVITGFWDNAFIERASRLRFIQVAGAGYDAFDVERLGAHGVRVANSSGVNMNAVSEHAMGLILSFTRRLHEGRDNQHAHVWRGMMADFALREDELPGKTLLIYGLGAIGSRLARLAKAFDMHVIGIRRDVTAGGDADELHRPDAFAEQLARADFVALTCPLTDATRGLMNADTFAQMRDDAILVNVARGGCVDEGALVDALKSGRIGGAGIDVTETEPLGGDSPLWDLPNVVLTPHTGGETRRYEDNVLDILQENLRRLWAGEATLVNQVV